MSNVSLELQYSDYENEYLQLNSILTDNSNGPVRDYKFALICKHPSTNLDLDMKSDINIRSRWYYFNNFYRFQKSLFYQKLRQNMFLIDTANSAVHWEVSVYYSVLWLMFFVIKFIIYCSLEWNSTTYMYFKIGFVLMDFHFTLGQINRNIRFTSRTLLISSHIGTHISEQRALEAIF